MKKIILSAAFMLSGVSAFGTTTPNLDFPSDSGWAVAMTGMACNVDISLADGYTGVITKTVDGVVYTVYLEGQKVLASSAANTSIWAKKTCLDG